MGHYRSEMMSDYEIALEGWRCARLRDMRNFLESKTVGELPLGLLGPALRILGQMGSAHGNSHDPSGTDFEKIATHFKITLAPMPEK